MTLNQLAGVLQEKLTDDDRVFLLSFKIGELDWGRYPLAAIVELPAPQFNLRTSANIGRPTRVALTRTSQHWTRRCPDRPATPLMKAELSINLPSCWPLLPPDELRFQGFEEGLDGGIVVTITLAAH